MMIMRWFLLASILSAACAVPSFAQGCAPAVEAFHKGEIPKAAEEARKCIASGKADGQVYKLLAFASFLLQKFDDFNANMEKAIELNPSDAEAHYHLGRYLYEKKLYKEAMSRFETAIKLDPQSYRAMYFLGLCKQGNGDLKGAEEAYRGSISVVERSHVQFGWPYADLADLLSLQGNHDAGLSWAYRATRNDPKLPYTHYVYARIMLNKEASYEVEQSLQRAIKLDPGYAQAYYVLGRYYTKIADKEKARDAFAKFDELKNNPAPPMAGVRR